MRYILSWWLGFRLTCGKSVTVRGMNDRAKSRGADEVAGSALPPVDGVCLAVVPGNASSFVCGIIS